MPGPMWMRSPEDENMLTEIGKLGPRGKVSIFDARPSTYAEGNRLKGDGYEDTERAYTNCELKFCDIGMQRFQLPLHPLLSTKGAKLPRKLVHDPTVAYVAARKERWLPNRLHKNCVIPAERLLVPLSSEI